MNAKPLIEQPSILVVEDDSAFRDVLAKVLSGPPLNASVVAVPDGLQALRYIMDYPVDCMVCDAQMPVMDGITMLRMVRAHYTRLELPVMIFTGNAHTPGPVCAFQNGASDYVIKPCSTEELIARVQTHVDIVRMQRQLRLAATTDPLTGVANRRAFMQNLSTHMARGIRRNHQLGFIMLDIDHFKNVNDTYGHPVGDAVIQSVCALMVSSHRTYDMVGRLGGEELAVLVPDVTPTDLVAIAERIRRGVQQTSHGGIDAGKVTASLGVSMAPRDAADTPDEVLKRADEQLYRAKHNGRNQVCAPWDSDDSTSSDHGLVAPGASSSPPAGGPIPQMHNA